jgi:hypothetical protein
MITVTKQEMIDFINSQPDDRMVNFNEVHKESFCGCIMVQYGISKGFEFTDVSIRKWHNNDEVIAKFVDTEYNYFIPHYNCTYGDIKAHLVEKVKI